MAKPKGQVGPPATAVPETTYVDPIKGMYETTKHTVESLNVRGNFSCEIYCHMIAAHTAQVIKDASTPQLTAEKMKMIAKEAVFSADILLSELANSNNRRI